MRKFTFLSITTLLLIVAPPVTHAGPYADDMAKCLVASTSAEDKTALVQWVFVMMALHPDVRHLAQVSDTQQADSNRKVASIFETLLTKSCLTETRAAIQYEGNTTIEASFNVLGQVAARALFADPDVVAGMSQFARLVDDEKMRKTIGLSQ